MEQPMSKEEWERIVKFHQNMYWHERCKADQLEKKSLQYLQIQDKSISSLFFCSTSCILFRDGPFILKGGLYYFSKKNSDSQCC
jgi:hypothetical protein